jgi:hypothetical protein
MRLVPQIRQSTVNVSPMVAMIAGLGCAAAARADLTPQAIPFSQNWTNIGLITTSDDWSGVPGVIGYRGDGMAGGTAVDPQTILVPGSLVIDVNANQTNPNTFTTGGVSEFHITNPVVALQGSGTARAPHIVITLNTLNRNNLRIQYGLRDIDGAVDNAVQPIALQYRVGTSGNYTNIPEAFVADASTGPSLATLVTQVSVLLPPATWNQTSPVQVRIMTTDAIGSDEWIGIDDIEVFEDSIVDTDGDGIPDSIDNCPLVHNPDQEDCDLDGLGDACDPINGDPLDCDGVPEGQDNCPNLYNPDQADCDGNLVGDACQIAKNPALYDCNDNGVLDACELAGNDCNNNGSLDACDVAPGGGSSDCNANGIPDECEEDCDGIGGPDACQIAANPALDANLDGILDACQIVRPVIINEVLADPASSSAGDANGDGTSNPQQDQFIELVNQSGTPVNIGGWTIATNNSSGNEVVRYQFAAGTSIAGNCSAVVFGGGLPVGAFGGAVVRVATHPSGLDLNFSDRITIRDGKGVLITRLNFSGAGSDSSITRNPEAVNGAPLVQHSSLPGGLLFSPGVRNTGEIFGGCTIPPDADGDGIPDASDNCPAVFNPNQADCDGDGTGDLCDTEPDLNGNGVPDACETLITLSEIRSDMTGSDCNEYVEIRGPANGSLSGITLVVIGDGTGGSGVIEAVVPLQSSVTPADGHFLIAETTYTLTTTANLIVGGGGTDCSGTGTLNLENTDNITVLLVAGFTGSNGQDLDTNDDGALDATPWSVVFDAIGILHNASTPPAGTEWAYGEALGFENVGPNEGAAPGHIYRCETSGTWLVDGLAITELDTPGTSNVSCPSSPCPADVDGNGDVDADDLVAVILAWGCVNPPGPCPADADGSGVVDADDLVMVILAWGPCP